MNRYTGRIVLGMALAVAAKMLATGALAAVQAQQTQPAAQTGKQETIPDAPSAVKPPTPSFPANIKPEPVYQPNHPSETTTAVDSTSAPAPAPAGAEAAPAAETTPPPPDVQAMPSAKTKPESETSSLDDFRITKIVNFVTVPVTVKDRDGHIVDGLQRKDFSVYEDNVLQNLSLFTSDPFPMSAAVVIDVGMADKALSKVNQTLPSITGAFSQYDEVAVYTYGNTVSNVTDFRAANERLTEAMRLAKRSGRQGGVPVVSGPMAVGPTVSGHPLDPSTPRVNTVIKESRVLNDALLQAALDLRDRKSVV